MSISDLPIEIIGYIAGDSMEVYRGIVLAFPFAARKCTVRTRLNYMERFGVDVKIEKGGKNSSIVWTMKKFKHRTDGPAVIYQDGSYKHFYWGVLHSPTCKITGKQLPSAVRVGKYTTYHKYGVLHRDDGPPFFNGGPAYESDHKTTWYQHGIIHRYSPDGDILPASIYSDGTLKWMHMGKLHSPTQLSTGELLPALIKPNGVKTWYYHGHIHRVDGPAVVYPNGCKIWYYYGVRHRGACPVTGLLLPAVELPNGEKKYYVSGLLIR